MAQSYLSNVPKLLGRENYDVWAFAVENFFVLEGLSKCLDGTETDEPKINKAKAKLVLTLDPSLFVHVKEARTATEIWTILKGLYDDTGFTRKIGLLRTLISLRLESSDSMESYVNHVIETAQKLRRTGFRIDEEWVGSLLLAGLPERFSPMIMAIEHSGIPIKTDSIKSKLLDMDTDGRCGSRTGGAFAGRTTTNGSHKKHQSGGADGNAGSWEKSKGFQFRNVKCFRCKQMGHFQNKCPQLAQSFKGKSQENKKQPNAFSVCFLNGKFNNSDWYIDSGASVHLTARGDWLEEVLMEPELSEVVVANKSRAPVVSVGNVHLTTLVNDIEHDVVVKNVLHVPELTTNLLSVSQLIKQGNKVVFNESCCKIYNRVGTLVAKAVLTDNVYKLVFKKTVCALKVSVTPDVWHRRFGHLNYKDLKVMSEGIVNGFECKNKFNPNEVCIVCCEGKQARLQFKHQGCRANKVLELIHADLCGPMEVTSLGGSRFFLLLGDDYTKMVFIYFLKEKSEALKHFIDFKRFAENQRGEKIKTFRSDNGGEFCSNAFETFLKDNGIVHQKSNPYTPQQNGVSERMNRTIVEKARCLLFDAHLEKHFWAEAANTAVYLRNRSVVAGLNKMTPFEMWHNRKPDVSNIRIFGSHVLVHIPKEKRLKWDKKSSQMILVGFSETVKGYRVYDPVTNNISTSRDVVIVEKTSPSLNLLLDDQSDEDPVGDMSQNTENNVEFSDSETDFRSIENDDDDEYIPPNLNQVNEPFEEPRRSERQRRATKLDDYVTYMCSDFSSGDEPEGVQEALSRPDADQWRRAMQEEMESFSENDAWDLVDLPANKSAVSNKWVFKVKKDSEGRVTYRARLVAKGFSQKQGIDYKETFSPVVRYSTLRLLIALAVKLDLKILHLDVKTAFLNGFLEEEVYMVQPEGFCVAGSENQVCKLKRAIYGLKQSSRAWYMRVDEVLTGLGYKKSSYEHCLYTFQVNGLLTIVALYVDDFFIFSNNSECVKLLKKHLNHEFKIKDMGEAKQCLGVRIRRNYTDGSITLDQEGYIDNLLKKFKMEECNSVSTPIENNITESLSNVGSNICDKNIPYQKLIGSLMYLAVLTRPDIAYSISLLSQFNNCYNELHWKCVKRVLRYLKGTKSLSLRYCQEGSLLHGFADADWASDKCDRRSYTGFVFMLSGGAVTWASSKQVTVALSSTEAEYMALAEAAKEGIYLKNLLNELIGFNEVITIFNDNQGAQKLSANPVHHKRSKHIDVRHHFIRDTVGQGLISVKHVSTDEMLADVLTKGLPNSKHKFLVSKLGLS